ncbi:MAG: hypothetical protein DIU78_023540 [Pseudomonadota bacterium]|nr:MAG: hypothetical protein DIU78_11355 [Pseudomonadota bacterium]
MRPRRTAPRDQRATAISGILHRLCEGSDAIAAALVDALGETVDYAGRLAPYDARVMAAELRILQSALNGCRSAALSRTHELVVRAARQSFLLRALSDGYALALALPRYAFRLSRRALAEAEAELAAETGLVPWVPADAGRWVRVEVRLSEGTTPRPEAVWLEGGWRPVTLVGRLQAHDLGPGEIGFLAQLPSGAELVLVREPPGRWFAGLPA